jgi:hypothetical protein
MDSLPSGTYSPIMPTGNNIGRASTKLYNNASSGSLVQINPQTISVVGGNFPHNNMMPYFKSISLNGLGKGISVYNSTGSFQVTGVGTTAESGGTISNKGTRGAELSNVTYISLNNMNFTNANTVAAAS